MPSSAVMGKFKRGQLHSGSKSGPKVKSRAQAIAIMLSERRNEQKHGGRYKSHGKFHGTKPVKHTKVKRFTPKGGAY